MHHTVPRSALGPGRLILVGDVHGCAKELGLLLAQLGHVPGVDNLVLVGDLVNKGPASVVGGWVGAGSSRQTVLDERRGFGPGAKDGGGWGWWGRSVART